MEEDGTEKNFPDPTLLDAHSYCWILARNPRQATSASPVRVSIIRQHFTGRLHPAERSSAFTPNDDPEECDMVAVSDRRTASGQVAEEIALQAEKYRLTEEGRSDLAQRVESVPSRPGFGFDIKSFNRDGTDRCIEVKNVSNGNRFFLSDWEWRNSRSRPNYWFYLVSRAESRRPIVTMLRSTQLQPVHLAPTHYRVSFRG